MTPKTSVKILIADDHPVFRRGLRQILEADSALRVIDEASNGREAINILERTAPDVVILDVDMPEVNGLDVIRHIRRHDLPVEIVVLTMYREEYMFNKTMDLGIRGYVLKESAVSDILAGVRSAAAGKYYVSPSITDFLVRRGARSMASPAIRVGF